MCIISDTRHGVMRAENRYGQMFLKSMFLRMKERGVSQTELAARMKASRPSVSKVLHGEVNITFASVVRFAKTLQRDFFPQLVQLATDEFNEPALLDFSLGSGSPCCRAIKRTKVVWNVLATSLSNVTPLRVR